MSGCNDTYVAFGAGGPPVWRVVDIVVVVNERFLVLWC